MKAVTAKRYGGPEVLSVEVAALLGPVRYNNEQSVSVVASSNTVRILDLSFILRA